MDRHSTPGLSTISPWSWEASSRALSMVRAAEARERPRGISFLDEGLTAERSDYIVIGGYPSDGKTALALSLAYRQARDRRVGFFSLETKTSKLFNRIYSSAAQVSGSRIKRRALTEEDYRLLEKR